MPKQNKTKLLDAIVLIWVITSSYCIKILLCAFPPVLPVIDLWIDSAQLSKHHCNQQLCTLIVFVIISLGMSPPRSRRAGSYVVYLLNLILNYSPKRLPPATNNPNGKLSCSLHFINVLSIKWDNMIVLIYISPLWLSTTLFMFPSVNSLVIFLADFSTRVLSFLLLICWSLLFNLDYQSLIGFRYWM